MRTIKNIDDEVIFSGTSDKAFVEFVQRIAVENEDFQTSIIGTSDAEEYLEDYCPDLTLID